MSWWQGASQEFAENASGQVHFFLYRRNRFKEAFRSESFLNLVEINSLKSHDADEVPLTVTILLGKELGYNGGEDCNSGSIPLLKTALQARQIDIDNIECIDDPWEIRALLCFDDEEYASCKIFDSLDNLCDESCQKRYTNFIISGWVLFGVALIGIIAVLVRKRRSRTRVPANPAPPTALVQEAGGGNLVAVRDTDGIPSNVERGTANNVEPDEESHNSMHTTGNFSIGRGQTITNKSETEIQFQVTK